MVVKKEIDKRDKSEREACLAQREQFNKLLVFVRLYRSIRRPDKNKMSIKKNALGKQWPRLANIEQQ